MNRPAQSATLRPRVPRGFLHVELLVCISIIMLLAACLLPAIVGVQEVARGATCKDHLHNVAIAQANYLHEYGSLPIGTVQSSGPVRSVPGNHGYSWCVRLLPYLEQRPLYELVDFDVPLDDRRNAQLREAQVSVFRCPSHILPEEPRWPPSDYAGVHHHVEAPIDSDNHGVLLLNRAIGQVDAPDGFSHTLLVGEKLWTPRDLGWASGTRATLRNTGHPLASAAAPALPEDDPLFVGGFASQHPDGVHFAFCDGSVRLLSWQTDPETLRRLADRADGELIEITAAAVSEPPSSHVD